MTHLNFLSGSQTGLDSSEDCLNTAEELGRGIVYTERNEHGQINILLVGETGGGKTTFLSLLANTLGGHQPDSYSVAHDTGNEAGGSQQHSQTNFAKLYEFQSKNGVKIRVLDTPGFADTRGLDQDEKHKATITKAIEDNFPYITAVIILANGTVSRLRAATDYALTTLTSIFPLAVAHNIGLVFTHVPNRVSHNFEQESLPEVLRRPESQFLINNPIALWKKYSELRLHPNANKRELKGMANDVREAHGKALDQLADLFDWLDTLQPQPANEIIILHEKSQEIERSIAQLLTRVSQLAQKRSKLEEVLRYIENNKVTIERLNKFKDAVTGKRWELSTTPSYNTVCMQPNCYSNCAVGHDSRHGLLSTLFMLADKGIIGPIFRIFKAGFNMNCNTCKHPCKAHSDDHVLWVQQDDPRLLMTLATDIYENTISEQEILKKSLQETIDEWGKEIEDSIVKIGELIGSYASLSLSGRFMGEVDKTTLFMELHLESMRNDDADPKSILKMEEKVASMKAMLKCIADDEVEKN